MLGFQMNQTEKCPLCNNIVKSYERLASYYSDIYDCPNCGYYRIHNLVYTVTDICQNKSMRALISYWIKKHKGNIPVIITKEVIDNIVNNVFLPKPAEQANNIIIWIGNQATKPDEEIKIPIEHLIAIAGALDRGNVRYIIEYLTEKGSVNSTFSPQFNADKTQDITLQLTFEGWDSFYELQRAVKDSRIAFMAMGYGNKQLDDLYNNTLKKAVDETGFKLNRLDENPKAGIIDNIMRVEIRKSKFIIADLSKDNRGAYWEAGFAEGLEKQVIYICEKSVFDKRHFDTNHCQTVPFDLNDKEDFAKRLKAAIRATFPAEAKMED